MLLVFGQGCLRKTEEPLVKARPVFYHRALLNRTSVHVGAPTPVSSGEHKISGTAWKHHLTQGSFSILTAHNPGAKQMSSFVNAHRNAQLEADLKRMGAVYHKALGNYGGAKENSFIVHHTATVQPHHINHLARRYGQESVFHSSKGKHRIHYVTGPNVGKHHPGEGHVMKPKARKDYTQPVSTPHGKVQAQIDFGRLTKKEEEDKKVFGVEIETDEGPMEVEFNIDHERLEDSDE